MKLAKILAVALAVIIVALLAVLFFYNPAKAPQPLQPIVSADGRVAVNSPQAGAFIATPVTVVGTVTGGGWFYEAVFPVAVLDGDGTVIGRGTAQAQADWTSTSSVPFTAIVQFSAPRYATGTIVLSKDNPSGAAQNDMSLTIPVSFK